MHGITPLTVSRRGRRQSDQLRHFAGYLDECFCSMRAPLCSMHDGMLHSGHMEGVLKNTGVVAGP